MIVGLAFLLFLLVMGNKCHGAKLAESKHLTSLKTEAQSSNSDNNLKERKLRSKGASGDTSNSFKLREMNDVLQQEASMARSLKANNPPKASKSPFKVAQQYESVTIRDNNNIINNDTVIPPNPNGAASLTTLVAVTSHVLEIRTKQGKILYRESLFDFFESLKPKPYPEGILTSPQIIYDEYEDKFVIVILYLLFPPTPADTNSTIFLAVSKDGSPKVGRDDWYFQSIDSLTVLTSPFINASDITVADFPRVAVSPEAVYVTTNRYGYSSGTFFGSLLYIVAKYPFYGGGQVTYTVHNPFNYSLRDPLHDQNTFIPAYVYGGSIGDGIGTFLVCYDAIVDKANNSLINVVTVLDPLGSPHFVSTYLNLGLIDYIPLNDNLPTAPQLGSTVGIATDDRRAIDAVWRNGKLWMTTTILPLSGPNANQSTAYWVEIDTTGDALSVVDQGEIGGEDLGLGTHTFFASVAVNTRGVVAFGFAASGPSIYAGAYVAGRTPTDPPGTVSKSFVVHEGIDSYNRTDFGTKNRWGDYTGTVVDPLDDTFWIFNEYADKRGFILDSLFPDQDGVWATAWRRFLSTSCSDDNTGTFYVPKLNDYKNCAWLKGPGGKGKPNYKRTFCQPVVEYTTVRLLCARTCGVCVA